MRKMHSLAVAITAVLGVGCVTQALAVPAIGVDPTGSGANFTYSDIWSDQSNTGVDTTTEPALGLDPGDVHTFTTQFKVSAMDLNGNSSTPPGFESTFEITKEIKFNDVVTAFTPIGGGGLLEFGYLADGYTNLTMYLDLLGDGSASLPGISGAGTVDCYGSGCSRVGYTGALDGDGTKILEGNLVANDSSFLASAAFTTGTGSFDLLFEITYYDPLYLDISQLTKDGSGNALYGVRINGTLTRPLQVNDPDHMWDGTTSASGLPFTIVSAETFVPTPEPTSLLLFGSTLGLLGAFQARRRKSASNT